MKRLTIGYERVSSDGQAEAGFGLDVQRERIESYAKAFGFEIDEHIVDDGYSGTTLNRPGVQRMIEMVERGEIGRIVVYKIDRLSRNLRRLLELYEDTLRTHNVEFVSVNEQIDTTTSMGKAMFRMIGVLAELDRDSVVERLREGRVARARTGLRAGGANPLGYRTIRDEHGRRQTVVAQGEIAAVRRVFELRRNGLSMARIAETLNHEGYRPKRGVAFFAATIQRILENQTYHGIIGQSVGGERIVATNEALKVV